MARSGPPYREHGRDAFPSRNFSSGGFPPGSFPLRPGRVHEVCGAGARGFAAMVLAGMRPPGLWLCPVRQGDALHPLGLLPFLDPAGLLLAQTRDQTDSLAVAEEALRDGAFALVVIEITRPLNLREGRRLQLAAQAGGATGLCLIPEGMGSAAVESRWRAVPVFDPAGADTTLMRWDIIKNKSGITGAWQVRWNPKAASAVASAVDSAVHSAAVAAPPLPGGGAPDP